MSPSRVLPILLCAVLAAGCTDDTRDDDPDTSTTQQLVCDSWPALSSTCAGNSVVYECMDGSQYTLDCRQGVEKCVEHSPTWASCEDDPIVN